MYYHMIIPVYDVLSHIWLNKSLVMALHLLCSISFYYRIVIFEINICFTEINCWRPYMLIFVDFRKNRLRKWLGKVCITVNILGEKRAKSKTTVEKNLYKLLANSTYGKFVETGLKRIKVKFASTWNEREAIIQKHGYDMIAGTTMYSENLIGIKLNTPVSEKRSIISRKW